MNRMEYSVSDKTTRSKYTVKFPDMMILLISAVCSGLFLLVNKKDYCISIAILPVLFGICYILFAAPTIRRTNSRTMTIVAVCEFLRCVVLPVYVAFSDYTGFGWFSTDDSQLIFHAVSLMAWEMVVIFVFLHFVIDRNRVLETENREVKLGGNKNAIYLILLIGLIIYVASPQVRKYINFLTLDSATDKVRGVVAGEMSTLLTGLTSYVHYAFLCVFILVLDAASQKSLISGKRIHLWIAVLVGLITVSVIFGESRATIVYTLYAVISCLRLKFNRHEKLMILVLVISAVIVFIGMTVYRLFAVYKYSSYSDAIAEGGYMGQNYLSRFLESYLLGPQSIAAGIEFKNTFAGSFTVERLLFDLFRPCMGFNFLLRRLDMDTTLTLYNSWLFGVAGRSNGNFLQITSQCYCYLGFLLSPLFACLFLWISVKIENWMRRTQNLFIFFFLSYVFIRTSTCVLGGTMSGYITNLSMTFLICGFFFVMQRAFASFHKKGALYESEV